MTREKELKELKCKILLSHKNFQEEMQSMRNTLENLGISHKECNKNDSLFTKSINLIKEHSLLIDRYLFLNHE